MRRTEELYAHWVQKLASTEFADELVVLAVAVELSIRIVIIPYTPESASSPWAIPNVRVKRCGAGCRENHLFGKQRCPLCVLETEELFAHIRVPRLCQAIHSRLSVRSASDGVDDFSLCCARRMIFRFLLRQALPAPMSFAREPCE